MRELSDGTCRPCTTSEVAALGGDEAPTRSPSVNPSRPLRTPVQPALSPLGRPALTVAPLASIEEEVASKEQQTSDEAPEEAAGASARKMAGAKALAHDQATAPKQGSRKPSESSDKENAACLERPAGSAARKGKGSESAATIGKAQRGLAQRADSEDTVTISTVDAADEDTETDGEFVPAKRVRWASRAHDAQCSGISLERSAANLLNTHACKLLC